MKSEQQRAWLADFRWTHIEELNRLLCQRTHSHFGPTSDGFEVCREQWITHQNQKLPFRSLLEFLRKCHRLSPFCFNNGNTFAAVAREIVMDLKLEPENAAVIRSAVGHFVAGVLREDELDAVLADFV